jgi:hypothetical protein
MSHKSKPNPKQDFAGGPAVTCAHDGKPSVGVETKQILDPQNGRGAGVNGGTRAPGAGGPALTSE